MRVMNDFLATVPFDLYELSLFRLIVKHGSFTKAAEAAGLTQSAISRQVQGMEESLGVPLLERTTREVRLTPAGEYLHRQAARLLGDVEQTLKGLREEFCEARKEVRVGVARSIGLAYLPGFFHANLRRAPEVACRMSYLPSRQMLEALDAGDLDLGVLSTPSRCPRGLQITHRFADAFTFIAPRGAGAPKPTKALKAWLREQPWILIDETSTTGQSMRSWLHQQGLNIEPVMQLDGFDPVINLVALGMGVSLVPIRALALYGRKRQLQRVSFPQRFERELAVVIRRQGKVPEHLARFLENILF